MGLVFSAYLSVWRLFTLKESAFAKMHTRGTHSKAIIQSLIGCVSKNYVSLAERFSCLSWVKSSKI